MKKYTVNYEADRLLAGIERDQSAPHYSEEVFRRKIDLSNRRALKLNLPLGGKESNYLLRKEWDEVVKIACLTQKQATIIGFRLEGYTFEDIGIICGHSKQGAQRIFFQAAKKLMKAWIEYPYRGLSTVFREEVRRGAPKTH